MFRLVFSFFFFLLGFLINAQEYESKHLGIKDGMPSENVRAIFKDSHGYMWFGTDAGLARYDGRNIKVFTSKDGLAGDMIWAIDEDKDGILWFGCYGSGVSSYDGFSLIIF